MIELLCVIDESIAWLLYVILLITISLIKFCVSHPMSETGFKYRSYH